MAKAPCQDIVIIKSVIYTLNSLQFPLEAARRGDENMSRIAGCIDVLEQLVEEAEEAEPRAEEVSDDA